MSEKKGLGSSIQILIGALVVGVLALMLFTTQQTSSMENIQTVSETANAYTSELTVSNLYRFSVDHPSGEETRLIDVAIYGCLYGAKDRGYRYQVAPGSKFRPERSLEKILDETVEGKYYFKMECGDENRVLEAGFKPADEEDVLVTEMEVPFPKDPKRKAYLYRWSE